VGVLGAPATAFPSRAVVFLAVRAGAGPGRAPLRRLSARVSVAAVGVAAIQTGRAPAAAAN